MKKKKFLIYTASGLIPLLIFLLAALINKYIPFGDDLLNVYDSFTQYPGILMEYGRLLKGGNIFYSWNGGLGFNFFGTLTYYGMSPLNLVSIFMNPINSPFITAFMIYLRIFLLGTSMCFYLSNKNTPAKYTILFSTCYALMGYTSAYYYNYLWIDSIIMLPIVIHGLDKLIAEQKPKFYLMSLGFTIIINYYIGYMICIFCLIYFAYNLIGKKNKKELIRQFIISSALAGAIGAIVIIPSYFALKTGKASIYNRTDYSGVNRNILTFFYTFLSGTYQTTDQSYGPAQVYSSILVLVLTFYYFFNSSYTKKQKIGMALVLLIFYASCSIRCLNYAWHFFQKPIWWQSRFSFVFCFFLIITACNTLINIDKTNFKNKYRIILSIMFIISCIIGAYFKWQVISKVEIYTYIFSGLSILIFLEMIFLVDKKHYFALIVLFTILDLFINSYNNLKNNKKDNHYTNYYYLKEDIPKLIKKLDKENDNKFYRFELADDFSSNDGLYFGYHGLNYFNSVRNIKPLSQMEKFGQKWNSECHIYLTNLDPLFLSLFNFKYIYGNNMEYYQKIDKSLYENPYPLSLGYVVSDKVKDIDLKYNNGPDNLKLLVNSMLGYDTKIYNKIDLNKFVHKNIKINKKKDKIDKTDKEKQSNLKYKFKSDTDYMIIIPNSSLYTIKINDIKANTIDGFYKIKKNDKVEITINIYYEIDYSSLYVYLLDIHEFEEVMKKLNEQLLIAKTDNKNHIMDGNISVKENNSFVFTSIEYEDGMKLYIDDKPAKIDLILDSFVGFNVDKGKHNIYVKYVPKGLVIGALITITSIISSTIYLQSIKKKL